MVPKKIIPICNGSVPIFIEKNVSLGFTIKENKIPRKTDKAALPENKTINSKMIKIGREYSSALKASCLSSINRYKLTRYKLRCI